MLEFLIVSVLIIRKLRVVLISHASDLICELLTEMESEEFVCVIC